MAKTTDGGREATARLLLLSNGHGEDAMGALLARALRTRDTEVAAFPLVGVGEAYRHAGIPVVGVQGVMPSGGFILEGSAALWDDIKAGLLGLTWRQVRALRSMSREYDWAVGVGDVYPLALNALFLRRPFVFIPTAKSDWIRPHYGWEVALMRQTCRMVFPRDERTAASLAAQRVPAEYLGNMMMDAITLTGEQFDAGSRPVVAILPGSRSPEAYSNTVRILPAVQELAAGVEFQASAGAPRQEAVPLFLLALAGSLTHSDLTAAAREAGWSWEPCAPELVARGMTGRLVAAGGPGEIVVVRGRFGDCLAAAQAVVGMSGTGNEQAAGMGVPVVAPPGPGPQFTSRFVQDQRRLLGEAVVVAEGGPAAVAREVRTLLADAGERERRGQVGRERMGKPGATARMAARILAAVHAGQGEGAHE